VRPAWRRSSPLTGKTDAFTPFITLLQQRFPAGQPSGLTNDNPFPIPA
jgi:hypothetical protein